MSRPCSDIESRTIVRRSKDATGYVENASWDDVNTSKQRSTQLGYYGTVILRVAMTHFTITNTITTDIITITYYYYY